MKASRKTGDSKWLNGPPRIGLSLPLAPLTSAPEPPLVPFALLGLFSSRSTSSSSDSPSCKDTEPSEELLQGVTWHRSRQGGRVACASTLC